MSGFVFFAVCAVCFIGGVFFTRWVFGIGSILKLLKDIAIEQRTQKKVITEIAKKQGTISYGDIDTARKKSESEIDELLRVY